MRQFNTKFYLTYKTLLSDHPSYLYSPLSLIRDCSNRSSSNDSRLKITNRSLHLTAPALWNSLLPDLRYFLSRSSSYQPNLNSPLFPFLFCLQMTKHISFSSVFRLIWPPIDYLWTDLSGIDPAGLICGFISLSFRYNSSPRHSLLFHVIWIGSVGESVIINCLTFTCRHFTEWTPFHITLFFIFISFLNYHFVFQFLHLIVFVELPGFLVWSSSFSQYNSNGYWTLDICSTDLQVKL
jgi:hypothetical protein